MADPRISEDLIIDIARRVGLTEDRRNEANADLKSIWSDTREQFRAAGLTGAEVSKEVALLKGAVAETRLDDADKTKRAEKADGVDSYLAILSSPRARARARRDKSEPLSVPSAAQEVGELRAAAQSSSGRTEPSADGQPNSPETATRSLDDLAAQDGLKMSSDRKPLSGLYSDEMNAGFDQGVTAGETAGEVSAFAGATTNPDQGKITPVTNPALADTNPAAAVAETDKPAGERDGSPAAPSFDMSDPDAPTPAQKHFILALRPFCQNLNACGAQGRNHCHSCKRAAEAAGKVAA